MQQLLMLSLIIFALLAIVPVDAAFLTSPFRDANTAAPHDNTKAQLFLPFGVTPQRSSTTSKRFVAANTNGEGHDNDNSNNDSSLEVVLFGVGDLRMDDHEGLFTALSSSSHHILPLVVLDDATLAAIPGAVAHTIDTAHLLVQAIQDLQQGLDEKFKLSLQVVLSDKPLVDTLAGVLEPYSNEESIRIHVHSMGDADNGMGYGPYASLAGEAAQAVLPSNVEIRPWMCHMREAPWANVESLPRRYPDFARQYTNDHAPRQPLSLDSISTETKDTAGKTTAATIPTANEIAARIQNTLGSDPETCREERNTGMYETHWGGLEATTVGESQVLKILQAFDQDCQEDDSLWAQHPIHVAQKKSCQRNKWSLEHATYAWMLRGVGGDADNQSTYPQTDNALAGEAMTRYLAAPLLFGTISPRRIWHLSQRQHAFFFQSPLQTLVEGREWHKLLAAQNLRTDPEYQQVGQHNNAPGTTHYGYWRWMGYLCRYAQMPLTVADEPVTSQDKEGVLLIHGFGASGTQWVKLMKELSDIVTQDDQMPSNMEGLAPDYIGFGQAEKPPISYSIYLWDAQISDFVKEVAVARNQWNRYIVGGNSIGGFGAASTAANECVSTQRKGVSSSGAPGTGRCQGVVLMNPAGPIQSRDTVEQMKAQVGGDPGQLISVAQTAAMDALPKCKPLKRGVARAFGNVLLSYLRPRIQSICANLYPTNPAAVDDALCENIERDSVDPGAINVMISGSKLPPPRSMNEMLQADYGAATPEMTQQTVPEATFEGPVLVATGVLDPLNDAKGRSAGLVALRDRITFDPINAGHCPHDELPRDVAVSITKWMSSSSLRIGGSAKSSTATTTVAQ